MLDDKSLFCDFFSERKRRATVFYTISQLELIAVEEEARKIYLSDNPIAPDSHHISMRRISLLDSAIDSLLALYPSLYGGEPF